MLGISPSAPAHADHICMRICLEERLSVCVLDKQTVGLTLGQMLGYVVSQKLDPAMV